MTKQSATFCITLSIITFLLQFPFKCLSETNNDLPATTCTIPGTTTPCNKLVSSLPWQFSIEEKEGELGQIIYLTPKDMPLPGMNLKIFLTVSNYRSQNATAKAFSQTCKNADPDTGISYGWDLVMIREKQIFHLHADCTLAEHHFEAVIRALTQIMEQSGQRTSPFLHCRCGGGCEQPK